MAARPTKYVFVTGGVSPAALNAIDYSKLSPLQQITLGLRDTRAPAETETSNATAVSSATRVSQSGTGVIPPRQRMASRIAATPTAINRRPATSPGIVEKRKNRSNAM